jgi:hypothetical protein
MDVASSGQASFMSDPTTLIDVLSIPTVCEVVLKRMKCQHINRSALRLACHAICALVSLLHVAELLAKLS